MPVAVGVDLHDADTRAGAGVGEVDLDGERIEHPRRGDRYVGIPETVAECEQWLPPYGVVPAVADEAAFEIRGDAIAARMMLERRGVLEPAGGTNKPSSLRLDLCAPDVRP